MLLPGPDQMTVTLRGEGVQQLVSAQQTSEEDVLKMKRMRALTLMERVEQLQREVSKTNQ